MPTVGCPVLLPTNSQLRAIVESGDKRRVQIGVSPLAANAAVAVDPDRLFGRHLAVLGNTGSGKSCSVAGLIHWCLDAAREAKAGVPNARFVVLDPNGEYARSFSRASAGVARARVFRVNSSQEELRLKVPLWLWNSAEWASFTQASPKTQRPVLVEALRRARDGELATAGAPDHDLRRFLRTIISVVRAERDSGSPWGTFPKPKAFFEKLQKWHETLEVIRGKGDVRTQLDELVDCLEGLCKPRRKQHPHYDFKLDELNALLVAVGAAHSAYGGSERDLSLSGPDSPRPFSAENFVKAIEATAEIMGVLEHVEPLVLRANGLLADPQIASVAAGEIDLRTWLVDYIGDDDARNGEVAILDLSLVPTEALHIVTSVVARMIFEAQQRYRRRYNKVLPTVLVLEEAHSFIRQYVEESDDQASAVCSRVFERIAREGRKFGLGLVLSSQRPSELSATVLSQCNTFLLHRLSNDRDQALVAKLVPDNLRGLLRELPSLPPQYAILLGWASELPVLTRIRDLPDDRRPQSDDPDFWDVWTGKDEKGVEVIRPTHWEDLASEWQGTRGTDKVDD